MTRRIEEPVTVLNSHHGSKTTHPAFAQMTLHRWQAGHGSSLYGSDFIHKAALTLRIHASELGRDISHDWHHATTTYIEVELSEAQWATFVSSVGQGSGVPCTLRYLKGEEIPALPDPTPRVEQFNEELADDLKRIIQRCDDLIANAKTKAQAFEIGQLKQDLEKNLPFVARSFAKHMEQTVEAAHAEIHGYMAGAIQRAGLSVLGGAVSPLALEHHETKDDEA